MPAMTAVAIADKGIERIQAAVDRRKLEQIVVMTRAVFFLVRVELGADPDHAADRRADDGGNHGEAQRRQRYPGRRRHRRVCFLVALPLPTRQQNRATIAALLAAAMS